MLSLNNDLLRQAYLEAAADQKDEHLAIAASASGVAGCRREGVYRVMGAPKSPTRPKMDVGEDSLAARMGNAIEPDTNMVLEAMGLTVTHVQATWAIMTCGQHMICAFDTEEMNDKFIQAQVKAHRTDKAEHAQCRVVCTGHPDGVITAGMDPFLGRKQEKPVVLEVKYMNFRRYIDLAKVDGIINNDDDGVYYTQAQLNMEGMGLDDCLFLAFAKDKTAVKWNRGRGDKRYEGHAFMHIETVEKSEGAVRFGLERSEEINKAAMEGVLLDPDYIPVGDAKTSSWQCRWCDWHGQCLKDLEVK